MTNWTFDEQRTQQRYEQLRQYYHEQGLNADSFACKYWHDCSYSTELRSPDLVHQYSGGTAGLCPFYDVRYQGREIRVLVIGKEESYDREKPFGTSSNFDVRSWNCLTTICSQSRTSHIQGTLLTLKRIFGVESEYVYASYALSNLLRCAFQRRSTANNTSDLQDTPTMRRNCMGYLVDEIRILEPTLIITQGAWAVDSAWSFISHLADGFGPATCLMKNQANEKYGLYEFSEFMCITSHHPARFGNWLRNLAPDSLWPMIDRLKSIGFLPTISAEDAKEAKEGYERVVKPRVDEMAEGWQSDRLLSGIL